MWGSTRMIAGRWWTGVRWHGKRELASPQSNDAGRAGAPRRRLSALGAVRSADRDRRVAVTIRRSGAGPT